LALKELNKEFIRMAFKGWKMDEIHCGVFELSTKP